MDSRYLEDSGYFTILVLIYGKAVKFLITSYTVNRGYSKYQSVVIRH
jgi:hypothetical protein